MALRTPGAATCPQTLRPSLGVVHSGTGQPHRPAPARGSVGSQEEQKQSVCTRVCYLGVTRSRGFTEGWFTCIRGRVCPLVSVRRA